MEEDKTSEILDDKHWIWLSVLSVDPYITSTFLVPKLQFEASIKHMKILKDHGWDFNIKLLKEGKHVWVKSVEPFEPEIYPDSLFNCLRGEIELEDLENGRRTRSRHNLENKNVQKLYISPWDLDFEGNLWNCFPSLVFEDKEMAKILAKKVEEYGFREQESEEFY